MSDTFRASKKLSWLLRHAAAEQGLALDDRGFADIADVLTLLRIPRDLLDAAVAENNKQRFEVVGERIRASQGHSAGVVSLDALEASWTPLTGEGLLWHGTSVTAIPGIAAEGLLPISRTHVHLAAAVDAKVGKRANVDLLLGVSLGRLREAGLAVFESPNGVLLARRVPREAIVEVRAASRKGEAALDEARAALMGS